MSKRAGHNIPLAWGLVALWGAFIWGLGGEDFALDETSRIIGPILHFLFPGIAPEQEAVAIFVIRKTAHVAEYGIFALLSIRALLLSFTWKLEVATGVCLAMVVALAAGDELRQSLSATRTGVPLDVVIDLSGATLTLFVFFAAQRWMNRSLVVRPGGLPSYWPSEQST